MSDKKAYMEEYRAKNRKKIYECQLKWRKENKEKCNEYERKYNKTHIKERSIASKKKYQRCKTERPFYYKELRKRNRELKKKNLVHWMEILSNLKMTECQACGYSRCFAALDFHHINPKEKRYEPGYLLNLFPTEERISEFKKCIALCANCHREGHNGFINIR